MHAIVHVISVIGVSKSVVYSCPQCNDLYQCRSFILANLDLHAHINIELLGMWSSYSFNLLHTTYESLLKVLQGAWPEVEDKDT